MTVWVVTIGGRINSLWAEPMAASAHVARLIEVNGDTIVIKVESFEVRS